MSTFLINVVITLTKVDLNLILWGNLQFKKIIGTLCDIASEESDMDVRDKKMGNFFDESWRG